MGLIPLSEGQQRLWVQQRLGEGGKWTMAGALRLKGGLDAKALRIALNALLERHETLRTRFVIGEDGEPRQVIDEAAEVTFEQHRVEWSQVDLLVRAHHGRDFDLANGPLFRVLLLELGSEEHVLSLAIHHIVADGWSLDVLVRDIRELYRATVEYDAPRLPPLTVQYADWAGWQKALDQSESIAFWKETLAQPPGPLALSTSVNGPDATRPAAKITRAIPEELAVSLTRFSRARHMSLFMMLTVGWALASYRRVRTSEVLLGTTVAGRQEQELEPLIGFFVNVVPIRLDLDRDPHGNELVDRVRKAVLRALEHQGVSFERLLGEVEGLRRPDGGSPIPLILRHQNYRQADVRNWANGLEASAFPVEQTRPPASDLDLQYFGDGADLTVTAEYDSNKFNVDEVNDLLDEVEMLLGRLIAEPNATLSKLIEATAEEHAEQAVLQGPTRAREATSILGLFAEQVGHRPDALACQDEERSLTYKELDLLSDRIALSLVARGVNNGERTALYMPRGVSLLAAILGTWKAGGVYVPVDPGYPESYAAHILADAEPKVVVYEIAQPLSAKVEEALPIALETLLAEQRGGRWQQVSSGGLQDLAYIAYTSGSTGEPKGIQVEHGQLLNCLQNLWETQPFVPGEVVAQKTATGFVVHMKEMFAGLLAGARQWIAPDSLVRDTPAFARALAKYEVTRLNLVPTQLAALLDHAESLGSLKWIVVAGEPLSESLRARVERLLPETHLYNNYGCTEMNDITYCHVAGPGAQPPSGKIAPMGYPISNTRLHLLDGELRPVPPGVIGELYVEGENVGAGVYWRQPELTNERLVPNPLDGGRATLFRTGDLAQMRRVKGGAVQLEYVGRADFQVKLRGQKVDPLGVEQVLGQHPGLSAVAVRGWKSGAQDAFIAAYYVVRPEDQITEKDGDANQAGLDHNQLHSWLSLRLPAHAVPSRWIRLDSLPSLPNGKLDRRSLPYPAPIDTPLRCTPQGAREQLLAALWAGVLRLPVEQIGRDDNFFAIGGNSFLAVQLLERMRGAGMGGDVQLLFNRSTLKELAEAEEESRAFEVPPNRIPEFCNSVTPEMLTLVTLDEAEIARIEERVPGGATNIQDIYPLAPLQEGLLFHYLSSTEGDRYLLSNTLALQSREDALALLDALRRVMNRHDVLRTAIVWKDLREPVQVVLRNNGMPVEEIEIPLSVVDAQQYLNDRFDPRRYRIDLESAPLLRTYLAKDNVHERWLLVLVFHHLIMDHTSLELVLQELATHLRGKSESLPETLPYRNFVAHARLGTNQVERERFFRNLLGGFAEPIAPFGISGLASEGEQEASLPLDIQLGARLREQARVYGVSVGVLFHLAWAHVLAETSGRDDVVFGTVLSGRMRAGAGADKVLGLFVNTLPMRVDVGESDVLIQLNRVNNVLSELIAHDQAPLALAQQCSSVKAPQPLFLTVLNYRPHGNNFYKADGGSEMPFPVEFLAGHDGGSYPVSMTVDGSGTGFVLRSNIMASLDAEIMCRYMREVLIQICDALEDDRREK